MQCAPQSLGCKIDEVPHLLGHETACRIDDADGNRIGLEFGKDSSERAISKMWGGLIGIEPRDAATCNRCLLRRLLPY